MSDEDPEIRWAPLPARPKQRWQIWLITALTVIVIGLLIVFLVFILPNGFRSEAAPSPTPTAVEPVSPSPTATPSAAPTATPTPDPTPEDEDETGSENRPPEPPPAPDTSLDQFAAQVRPMLDDARTGLDYAAQDGGEAGAEGVLLLRQDAERLSDSVAPDSIADDWSRSTAAYITALDRLQDAYRSGGDVTGADRSARGALGQLRDLAGL